MIPESWQSWQISYGSSQEEIDDRYLKDVVMLFIIFICGCGLNLLIFVAYFRIKTDLAMYIRVFAVFDFFMSFLRFTPEAVFLFHPTNIHYENFTLFAYIFTGMYRILYPFTMLGPLFLALDRFLIVIYPLDYKIYLIKMRIFKACIFSLTLCMSIIRLVMVLTMSANHKSSYIFERVIWAMMGLEFLFCVSLYTVIVVKIVASERKMKTQRHIANTNRCVWRALSSFMIKWLCTFAADLIFVNFRQNSNKTPRHLKSMRIGISLLIVFVISFVPSMVFDSFTGQMDNHVKYNNSMNFIANFFIYFLVDEEFRFKLREICCQRCSCCRK